MKVPIIRPEDPMLPSLALALLVPATAVPPKTLMHDDPPIRLELSEETYARGDRARVRVKARENGFLVVLRVNSDGRVRVLYPLRPDDDGAIRGAKQFEVRSRGDREAFTVDEGDGVGAVLAAWSAAPFVFDSFARGGHWDYRALAADSAGLDREDRMLAIVDRMTDGDYDYDIVNYTVESSYRGRHYSGWYDPWWHGYYGSCFGCGPFYGSRFSVAFGFGHRYGYPWRRWW